MSTISIVEFKKRLGGVFSTPVEAFQNMDQNGDKQLDLHEFVKGSRLFVPPLSPEEAEYAFVSVDGDEDGKVSDVEFSACLKMEKFFHVSTTAASPQGALEITAADAEAPLGSSQKWLSMDDFVRHMKSSFASPQDAFRAFAAGGGAGGSNCMDVAEFTAGVARLLVPINTAAAHTVFGQFDNNGDGRVCSREFFGQMQQGHFAKPTVPPALAPKAGQIIASPERIASRTPSPVHSSQIGTTTLPPQTTQGTPSTDQTISVAQFTERMGKGTTPQFAFASLDVDGDGSLRLGEFLQGATAFSPALSQEEAEFAFHGLDRDQDGIVKVTEFAGVFGTGHWNRGVSKGQADEESKVTVQEFKDRMAATKPQDVFLALDRNGDGFVERDEFITGRQAFTPAFTKEQADYIFRGLDVDRDQRVCSIEFHAVLKTGLFFQTPKALEAAKASGMALSAADG